MARRKVTLEKLGGLAKAACLPARQAVSHTTTVNNSLGYYEAVVEIDGQLLKLSCEALNPLADGYVQEITPAQARALGC